MDQMEMDKNKVAHGRYIVKGTEYFLQGHFPGYPVVPGVILCEIMGQCCSLLVKEHLAGRTPFYTGLDNVRFKRQVRPGDTVEVSGYITRQRAMVFLYKPRPASMENCAHRAPSPSLWRTIRRKRDYPAGSGLFAQQAPDAARNGKHC